MPCSDSSSSITLRFDTEDRFKSFEFAKITCGREITATTGLSEYLKGLSAENILELKFPQIQQTLKLPDEESNFILYLEWDALRSAIAQYLGISDPSIDGDRCRITSIDETNEGVEVAEVILPPRELPKILPCSLSEN